MIYGIRQLYSIVDGWETYNTFNRYTSGLYCLREQYHPKLGERISLFWKAADGKKIGFGGVGYVDEYGHSITYTNILFSSIEGKSYDGGLWKQAREFAEEIHRDLWFFTPGHNFSEALWEIQQKAEKETPKNF